jgi:3-hydroxybutyryl-CoA dehydrogenase
VVGAGTMGAGIAEVFARAGLPTTLVDIDRDALALARERIAASLRRAVNGGRLDDDPDDVIERIVFADSLGALDARELIVEAIVESEPAKAEVFHALGSICRLDTILASNSSSIPIQRLADVTFRPARVIGIHFFNPAPVQPLVEVVAAVATDTGMIERVVEWCENTLDKHVVRVPDRPGFIVSTLLIPFLLSAMRMVESGVATASEIDDGMRFACAHSMGPLALSDLMGLDTVKFAAEVLFAAYGDAQYAPPTLLERMVRAGLLGRKSGEGFFRYEDAA